MKNHSSPVRVEFLFPFGQHLAYESNSGISLVSWILNRESPEIQSFPLRNNVQLVDIHGFIFLRRSIS
jgi:hypothetical protein